MFVDSLAIAYLIFYLLVWFAAWDTKRKHPWATDSVWGIIPIQHDGAAVVSILWLLFG